MKTVLITGASGGIGRALALKFGSEGYNIVINYNKHYDKAMEVAEKIRLLGGKTLVVKADVGDFNEVKDMINTVQSKFGFIDILINNAGIAQYKLFQEIEPQEWKQIFDVNVGGVFNTCKCIIPSMINAKKGVIINMASIWGMVGGSMEVHYSATKGAVISMTKALAKELAPSGIRVNAIAPGAIKTSMSKLNNVDEETLLSETPLGRLGMPEEVAELAYFLTSDSASFITGQIISPNGGLVI